MEPLRRKLPRYREPPGPEATIGELLSDHSGKWVHIYCTNYLCGHHAAIALASFAIRHGFDAPMTTVRRGFRCSVCGLKGANVVRPLTSSEFPVESALQAADRGSPGNV